MSVGSPTEFAIAAAEQSGARTVVVGASVVFDASDEPDEPHPVKTIVINVVAIIRENFIPILCQFKTTAIRFREETHASQL